MTQPPLAHMVSTIEISICSFSLIWVASRIAYKFLQLLLRCLCAQPATQLHIHFHSLLFGWFLVISTRRMVFFISRSKRYHGLGSCQSSFSVFPAPGWFEKYEFGLRRDSYVICHPRHQPKCLQPTRVSSPDDVGNGIKSLDWAFMEVWCVASHRVWRVPI